MNHNCVETVRCLLQNLKPQNIEDVSCKTENRKTLKTLFTYLWLSLYTFSSATSIHIVMVLTNWAIFAKSWISLSMDFCKSERERYLNDVNCNLWLTFAPYSCILAFKYIPYLILFLFLFFFHVFPWFGTSGITQGYHCNTVKHDKSLNHFC